MGIHAGWLGTALRGVYPTLRVGTLASFVRQKKKKNPLEILLGLFRDRFWTGFRSFWDSDCCL